MLASIIFFIIIGIVVSTDCLVRLQVILWDTSEMEMNGIKGMTRSYFTNSVAAILVYDIGELDSLNKLDEWVDRLEWSDSADIVLSMWGNDKGNTNNLVSDENSRGFAGIHGVKEELMFKVNAKSGWKVVESYHRVIEEVCSRYSSHNAEPSPESYKWTRFFGYSASVDSGTYTNPASLQSSHATNPHGPGVLQVQVDDRVRLVPDHEPHPGGGEEQRSKCFIFKMC